MSRTGILQPAASLTLPDHRKRALLETKMAASIEDDRSPPARMSVFLLPRLRSSGHALPTTMLLEPWETLRSQLVSDAHSPKLHLKLYEMLAELPGVALGKDLHHNLFARILSLVLDRNVARLRQIQQFGPYCLVTARRLALDLAQSNYHTSLEESCSDAFWGMFSSHVVAADRRELRQVLLVGLSQLPIKEIQAIRLCDIHGLSPQEAADRLCRQGNKATQAGIQSQLKRAHRRLALILSEAGWEMVRPQGKRRRRVFRELWEQLFPSIASFLEARAHPPEP
jgi:DNA-directed RNA polymerase specialized sigma24 family protein